MFGPLLLLPFATLLPGVWWDGGGGCGCGGWGLGGGGAGGVVFSVFPRCDDEPPLAGSWRSGVLDRVEDLTTPASSRKMRSLRRTHQMSSSGFEPELDSLFFELAF